METTLDKFGRIVIPKEIRDDFNLKPGSQIRIEESEQAIIIKTGGRRTKSPLERRSTRVFRSSHGGP